MECLECKGDLIEATVVVEKSADDGRHLREEVSGWRCRQCGEEVLSGSDARRLSQQWLDMRAAAEPQPAGSAERLR